MRKYLLGMVVVLMSICGAGYCEIDWGAQAQTVTTTISGVIEAVIPYALGVFALVLGFTLVPRLIKRAAR